MSTGLALQYIVVCLVVLASALIVFRKLAPQLTNRWLAAASIRLSRRHDSRIAQSLSQRLQPKQATGSCADGCSTCGACGTKKPASIATREGGERDGTTQARTSVESMPLHFRQRSN